MQAEGGPAQRSACRLRASFIAGAFGERDSVGQVRLVGLEELKLARAHERLGAALHIKLAVEVVDVSFDRTDREDQGISDRLIGMTIGDQAQDFELAVGEWLDQVGGLRLEV